MKKNLTALFFIFIFFPNSSFADEMQMRNNITEETRGFFFYEEFNTLEKMSQLYLEKRTRTQSGVWRLSVVSRAIDDVAHGGGDDDERWRNVLEKIEKWIFKYPDSSQALITKGVLLVNYAWHVRGNRFASEVSQKDWPKFLGALKVAKKYMLSIKDKAEHNPEWYLTMITISRGLNEDEATFKSLVKEALDKHPYYHELYFNISEFLKPKWGGDYEKIENLANYGVEKTSLKEGKSIYTRIYWNLYSRSMGDEREKFFQLYNLDWDKMKRGIYDLLKQYPDPWNVNNLAFLACQAKDKETTKDLIEELNEPNLRVWETPLKFENCKRWANGQPIEKPQDTNHLNLLNMELNQWFEQLSITTTMDEGFEGYRNGMKHFYDNRVTSDYKRDVKIKHTSVCETNDKIEDVMDKIQTLKQTKDELIQAETSVSLSKVYDAYEHSLGPLSYNDVTKLASLTYNLKLSGKMEEVGGFAGSEIESFPFDEFRQCSANFIYTEDNLLRMTFENCEILVQKGCAGKPKHKPKKP